MQAVLWSGLEKCFGISCMFTVYCICFHLKKIRHGDVHVVLAEIWSITSSGMQETQNSHV